MEKKRGPQENAGQREAGQEQAAEDEAEAGLDPSQESEPRTPEAPQ